jgi:hypothetical protein
VKEKENKKKEERLCKIVYNSRGWTNPCERVWNPVNWENKNSAYEQRTGFVHEDWLFNTQFLIDGFQYGYIKGFSKLKSTVSTVDCVHLFTINPNTKERLYIGKLNKAERLVDSSYPTEAKKALKKYFPEMLRQLKEVGADYKEFKNEPLVFNVRVRSSEIEIFPEPIPIIGSWFYKNYTRTSPNLVNDKLREVLENAVKNLIFSFTPSTPGGKTLKYVKHTKMSKSTVSKVHQEMEEALYAKLKRDGYNEEQLACDTTSFGGKLADLVIQHSAKSYSIYEIKTDLDLRKGLRDAVGQLLDYANWECDIVIKKLYAVLPDVALSSEMENYIDRVVSSVNHKLGIILYDKSTNLFKEIK